MQWQTGAGDIGLALRAGAPLQFKYSDAPVLDDYARYPGLDFVKVYDFGCPNITDPTLRIHPPDPSVGDQPDAYCWITGTVQVRHLRYKRPCKFNQLPAQHTNIA